MGIDVGGTNIRTAIYDETSNKITDIRKVAFLKSGNPKTEVDNNLCNVITTIIEEKAKENKMLGGIGLSVASLFDRLTGCITIWPNNKTWDQFPLKEYLLRIFDVPILMEDDANSAAFGEHSLGAGRGYNNLAYITIGTGIGCGLVLNNTLYIGSNGWAGEIGHVIVIDDGPVCKCGMRGCLQSVASGPAILRNYNGMIRNNSSVTDAALGLGDVVNLAKKGDWLAIKAFSQAAEYIGRMAASLVMLLDVSIIVLGGGVSQVGDILIKPVSETLNTLISNFNRNVVIENSYLRDNSGVYGALALIYKLINNNKTIPVKDSFSIGI